MAKKTEKTNAMRKLDTAGVVYQVLSYIVDEKNFDGSLVAQQLGLSEDCVFKTIVTRTEKSEIIVCCIPVGRKIDLKSLAAAARCKAVQMVHQDELLPLTGYIRGGCSPIAMKKNYRTFIDQSALLHQQISVSAGLRGLQIFLAPTDLTVLTAAHLGSFTALESGDILER